MTIQFVLINDNLPVLLLDGRNELVDYSTVFSEGQDYLGGPQPVMLSDELMILDDDVGPKYLISADIFINPNGKPIYTSLITQAHNLQ